MTTTGTTTHETTARGILAALAADRAAALQAAITAADAVDGLRSRLAAGDTTVTAEALQAAEAAASRLDLLSRAGIDQAAAAEEAVQTAVIEDLFDKARRTVRAGPVAELREATQQVRVATQRRDRLLTAYASSVVEMGTALRDAGAPRVPIGSGEDGWHGRPDPYGVVLGFSVDGTSLCEGDR